MARFQIDRTHSNAYTTAGGKLAIPFPTATAAGTIRQTQELAIFAPIQRNVAMVHGTFHDRFNIDPFTVMVYWITPFIPTVPVEPSWIKAVVKDGHVIVRWEPNVEPFFYTYELYLMSDQSPSLLFSPAPLRASMWIDTMPSSGTRIYGVRTISASDIASTIINSNPVTI